MELLKLRAAYVIVLTTALVMAVANAHAGDYYKWTDAHGTVHFSQTPPPAGQKSKLVHVENGASTPPPPGLDYQPQTAAQKAKAISAQSALERADVKAVDANCATARRNITQLALDKPLALSNASDVQTLTPDQRTQALADAQTQAAKYCSRK